MENQGKRLLLAVALALGIVLLWNVLFPQKKPTPKPKVADQTEPAEKPRWESPVARPAQPAAKPEAGPAAEAPDPSVLVQTTHPEEKAIELDYPNVHVAFTSRGARMTSWQLTASKWQREPHKGEMIVDSIHGAFATNFVDSTYSLPPDAVWDVEQPSEYQVVFTFTSDKLSISKSFTIHPDALLVELAIEVKNLSGAEAKQRLALSVTDAQDPKLPTKQARVNRVMTAACHLNGSVVTASAPGLHANGPKERGGTVRWFGFTHPYLFFAIAPRNATQENLACNMYPVEDVPGGMDVDLVFSIATLKPGDPAVRKDLVAYIGPKSLSRLEGADDIAGFHTGFSDAVSMGWFSFIARPLLSLLMWLQGFVGNWGIAIIILTIFFKIVLFYWNQKAMNSMKEMQKLKPKMDELKEKYGTDKQRMNQEMMNLYKTHKINPLGGCLPMLLQMPIWFALYRTLYASVELFQAPFALWITDLSARDPYYIMPVLLGILMFVQQKMSQSTVDNPQAKMLLYFMPAMFTVLMLFLPAGLVLYIFTNTVLSIVHQLYINRSDKKPGAERSVAAPGRA